MRVVRGVLGCVVSAALLVAGAAPRAAANETAFTITDSRITQSSGLAADPRAQVYWTVNDDGPGKVYALAEDGSVKAVLSYGANITDVEAVARGRDRLYVGDIGDNKNNRSMITVYSFLNPQVRTATLQYRAWDFVYPDGKGHDAEALLVDDNARVWIVTKEAKGAIYTFRGTPSPQGTNKLTKVADAPPYVTDGTFLPDGRMALRTYVGVYVLNAGHQVEAEAGLPLQRQGESLTTSLADQEALLIGSEGTGQPVLSIPIPAGRTAVPTASAPPTGESTTASPAAQDDSTGDNSGTWWALGIAALVALVAALITALLGRRRGRRESEPPARETSDVTPSAVRGTAPYSARSHGPRSGEEPAGEKPADGTAERARRADLDWLYEDRG